MTDFNCDCNDSNMRDKSLNNIVRAFILVFNIIFILINFCEADDKTTNKELIIFSEHNQAFYAEHEIKLLDVSSKNETSLGIKTYSYGDFYIVKDDSIAWIKESKLCIWDPRTRFIDEKILPIQILPPVFLISISPSGGKIAYLKPYGKRLYLGGEPKKGQPLNSLGFKSELHIFDLAMEEDVVITDTAIDWEAPQWSPDEKTILYVRPERDTYFDQDFLDKVEITNDSSRLNLSKSAIFIYDFDKKISYKLCSGISPSWAPSGKKIAFYRSNNQISILNLFDNHETTLEVKETYKLILRRLSWSLNEDYIAYIVKPKLASRFSLLSFIRDLSKGYEETAGLCIIKISDGAEKFIETKNFGNVKFAPESFKSLLK